MYFDLHETNASRRYKMSGGAPEACFDDGTMSQELHESRRTYELEQYRILQFRRTVES